VPDAVQAPAPVPAVHAPAPVPAPAAGVPDAVAAMLERLVPDRITAFVQRLERTKRKQDADPVCFLLNDILGANYISMNNIPKVVRARFATAMTDNGFDLKAVGATGMHYRSREFPKEVIRLQRQADRPTDCFFWGGGLFERVWEAFWIQCTIATISQSLQIGPRVLNLSRTAPQ